MSHRQTLCGRSHHSGKDNRGKGRVTWREELDSQMSLQPDRKVESPQATLSCKFETFQCCAQSSFYGLKGYDQTDMLNVSNQILCLLEWFFFSMLSWALQAKVEYTCNAMKKLQHTILEQYSQASVKGWVRYILKLKETVTINYTTYSFAISCWKIFLANLRFWFSLLHVYLDLIRGFLLLFCTIY